METYAESSSVAVGDVGFTADEAEGVCSDAGVGRFPSLVSLLTKLVQKETFTWKTDPVIPLTNLLKMD